MESKLYLFVCLFVFGDNLKLNLASYCVLPIVFARMKTEGCSLLRKTHELLHDLLSDPLSYPAVTITITKWGNEN